MESSERQRHRNEGAPPPRWAPAGGCRTEHVARSKRDVYYCNLAACLQQLEDDAGAIAACTSAIEESPKYVKAYMRRSQAYEKLEKYAEALKDLEEVVKLAQRFVGAMQVGEVVL